MTAAVAYRFGGVFPKWRLSMASSARISALSTELVRVGVTADTGGAPVDPSANAVAFAFVESGAAPVSGDWTAGTWDVTLIGTYVAQVAPSLAAGSYDIWTRITDETSDEIVVRQVGSLLVE